MINQSINEKLDDMLSSDMSSQPPIDAAQSNEFLQEVETNESIFADKEEQLQVAGRFSKKTLETILQPLQKSLTRKQTQNNIPEVPKEKIDTTTIPKSEAVNETDAVQVAPVQPTVPQVKPLTKKQKQIKEAVQNSEQFTPEQILVRQRQEAEKIASMREEGKSLVPGDLTFNYESLNTSDDISALIEANAKMYGIKSENITFEEVAQSASEAGFSKKEIENLMSGKLEVNPVTSYQTNQLIKILTLDLDEKLSKVKKGEVTEQQAIQIMKDAQFNGLLLQNAKGHITNLAQSFGVLRAKVDNFSDLGELTGLKTIDEFKQFAEKYTNASNDTKKKLVNELAKGKTIDKLSMIYVGGLLSRPGTHIKNIVSTLSAVPLRWANKSTAAGIDVARYGFGKLIGQDVQRSVYFAETLSEIVATKQALLNGFNAARFAYKNGFRQDALAASKFETSKIDVDIFDVKEGSPFAGFFKFFNYAAKAPGKALFIGDEFLKGVNYTYELESYATRQAIKAHDDVLMNKGTIEEAAAAYDQMAASVFDNPPDFIYDKAIENVFLKPLEPGLLKKFKDVTNDPSLGNYILKTQIPFLQTPTNLYSQVFEQIPALAFATKKARQDIASGDPAKVQMVIAKQATGLGAMYIASNFAAEGSITGPGPSDRAEFKRLIDQGWKPYSIVLDFSGLTPEQRAKYDKDERLAKGTGNFEGKYFVSYEGLEPIGALMAFGASYAEYAKYEDDPNKLNALIHGALPGIAEYAMSHPLLEGIQRIGKALTETGRDLTDQKADEILNDLIAYTAEIGYKSTPIFGQLSGLKKSTAQAIDPYQRDYKINGDEHPALKGIFQAYNKIASGTPGLSATLPKKINIWNEPLTNDVAWSPLMASKGKALAANEILIATKTPYGAPSDRISETINGIPVSIKMLDSEYRELIAIANDELMLSDRIINKAEAMGESINLQAIKGTPVQLAKVQNELSLEMERTFSKARKILIERSPEIKQRLYDEFDIANESTIESSEDLGI